MNTHKDKIKTEMDNVQMRPRQADPHDHKWDASDVPTPDDEGDWDCYARCSRCGAVENEDESILDCPGELTYKDSDGNLDFYCDKSKRVDGKFHSWKFDGDDPYIICEWCGETRSSTSGLKIK